VTGGGFEALARDAAARYPARERFARIFAYGKLTRDPVFAYILQHDLIPPRARVLDLGSGQGVLAALLAAAGKDASVRGIELARRDVERARTAAGNDAQFVHGDIRTTDFGSTDVCVLLDVLHYLEHGAQEDVLRRVSTALAGGGVLLIRVPDGSRALRFRLTLAMDRLAMALRGRFMGRYHCRPLAAWIEALAALGFSVEATPMSGGTPFANVLLVARYDRPTRRAP
jgi:trans-aconitate methyltransferase